MIENRYQVVTWSDDVGTDEKMDFRGKREAERAARSYLGSEDYAAVYDKVEKAALVIFGNPKRMIFSDFVKVYYKNGRKICRVENFEY